MRLLLTLLLPIAAMAAPDFSSSQLSYHSSNPITIYTIVQHPMLALYHCALAHIQVLLLHIVIIVTTIIVPSGKKCTLEKRSETGEIYLYTYISIYLYT